MFINPYAPPHTQKIIVLDSPIGDATLSSLHQFNANRKLGFSNSYLYTINGTFEANGALYEINRPCRVKDEFFGIDEDMTITRITFMYNPKAGATTELLLSSSFALTGENPQNAVMEQKLTNSTTL